MQLGNLSAALNDSKRASELLKTVKFVDPRRVLAVDNAMAQTMIISGSINAAAGCLSSVTHLQQKQNEEEGDLIRRPDELSYTSNINGKRRPSMSKTTLSRFFLHQHGECLFLSHTASSTISVLSLFLYVYL